jgi:hypothetical protein
MKEIIKIYSVVTYLNSIGNSTKQINFIVDRNNSISDWGRVYDTY